MPGKNLMRFHSKIKGKDYGKWPKSEPPQCQQMDTCCCGAQFGKMIMAITCFVFYFIEHS